MPGTIMTNNNNTSSSSSTTTTTIAMNNPRKKKSSNNTRTNTILTILVQGLTLCLLVQYYMDQKSISSTSVSTVTTKDNSNTNNNVTSTSSLSKQQQQQDESNNNINPTTIIKVESQQLKFPYNITRDANTQPVPIGESQSAIACWLSPAWGTKQPTRVATKEVCADDNTPYTKAIQLSCTQHANKQRSIPKRNHSGITIAILYYANPALLLAHLESLVLYPKHVQEQITILLIDDASPDTGLQAKPYLEYFITKQNSQQEQQQRWFMTIRLVRITTDKAWNIGGARNLALYLADTPNVLLTDLDITIPSSTIEQVLTWETMKKVSSSSSTTNNNSTTTKFIAHRFMRKKLSSGQLSKHPAVTFLHTHGYWSNGGCDEDFVGRYGNTDVHFWHRWNQDLKHKQMKQHDESAMIIEMDGNDAPQSKCDDKWVPESLIMPCRATVAFMQLPEKNPSANRGKLKQKTSSGCWSNRYLRFRWYVEI